MSYADLDGVPSQTAGTSSLVASDWNTYVRDNFDSLKFGHVVVADNTAKSAISAVEGVMVYQSDVDTLFLYTGSAWVPAVDTVSLVDSAVETVKINDLAVTTAKINDLGVTTGKINDLGVTTGKIAASAVTSAKIADDTIVNADINSAAAIVYSKLSLGTSIVNADISASAAIAYSKLNLASSITSADIVNDTIVNADVNSAAAIAYSKLNLATSIVNADVSATAAIAYSKLNLAASVTSADIVDNTIVLGDLATALQAFLTPTGTVSAFAGASAPTGYLLCDGAPVSRSNYAALWTALGTTSSPYGQGDGSSTFNTPNLKGRTIIGVGVGADASPVTGVIGVAQGKAEHALSYGETGVPAHSHPISDPGHSHTTNLTQVQNTSGDRAYPAGGDRFGFENYSTTTNSTGITATSNNTASAATAHTNIQPSMPLNYIIKV